MGAMARRKYGYIYVQIIILITKLIHANFPCLSALETACRRGPACMNGSFRIGFPALSSRVKRVSAKMILLNRIVPCREASICREA